MSYRMMLWFVVTVLAVESLVMSNVWTLGVALCLSMIAMWLETDRSS